MRPPLQGEGRGPSPQRSLKGGIVAPDRELRFAEEAIVVDLRDQTHMVLRYGAQISEAAIAERNAVGTLPYEAGGFGVGKVTQSYERGAERVVQGGSP